MNSFGPLPLRPIACILLAFTCADSWATLACNASVTPTPVLDIYSPNTANLNILATVTLSCTRDPAADPKKPNVWIGLAQGAGGNVLNREIPTGTLNYTLGKANYGSGLWTNTGNQNPGSTNTGGMRETGIDFGNTGATWTSTYPLYIRVPAGQTTSPAGVYVDPVQITVRNNNDSGAVLSTNSFELRVSIPKDCRFSTDPAPISINYTAFSASPVLASTDFALTCTQGTNFTMALDKSRGRIPTVSLAYDISLTSTGSQGTASPQAFSVNVSVDAGQAGACPAGNCTGTDTPTITVTY